MSATEIPSIPTALEKDSAGNYIFKWKVTMSCGGCSGAVINKLKKYSDDVLNVEADHDITKIVTVTYKANDITSAAEIYNKLQAEIPKKLLETYPPISETTTEAEPVAA